LSSPWRRRQLSRPPIFPARARPRKMISIQKTKKDREREMDRYFFGIEKMIGYIKRKTVGRWKTTTQNVVAN
jgi:hypothetical protein